MVETKQKIKIAGCIQQALSRLQKQKLAEAQRRIKSFTENFKGLDEEARKLGLALFKQWFKAAERSCTRIDRLFNEISYWMSRSKDALSTQKRNVPGLRSIVEELDQIEADLGGYQFDSRENTLSVTTEPITMEGIYLGPFQIMLHLNRLAELYTQRCYYVIALDPHPASTDEGVTHPHVSNEQICEGEGAVSIKKALEQGRFCDFFSMVESILKVYNPDSPYVSIDQWQGICCYECGFLMCEHEVYYCEFCDHDFCSECTVFCPCCEEVTACLACSVQCNSCGDTVCPECHRQCEECGETFCVRCIENGLCPNCLEERKVEDETENKSESGKQQSEQISATARPREQ